MNSKIEIKLNDFSFSSEGDEKWVSEQLDKILLKLPALQEMSPRQKIKGKNESELEPQKDEVKTPLVSYLKSKNATINQTKKFLATAVWLHNKGLKRLSTSDVTKALKDSNQSRLGNASECLNSNISKGTVEKEGNQFFVTDEGYNELK